MVGICDALQFGRQLTGNWCFHLLQLNCRVSESTEPNSTYCQCHDSLKLFFFFSSCMCLCVCVHTCTYIHL